MRKKGDLMAQADTHDWPVKTQQHPLNWPAAIWASIIAGLVFAALEMVLVRLVDGMSPWMPLHLIGAIGLGPDALAPANTFDVKIVGTAVAIHMALAILYGVILAFIIQRLDIGWALLVGAIYGLVLYYINFFGFTAAFPWFADARGGVSIFTHIVQSGLMALLYKMLDKRSPA
jgi:hypothetical protein